ncbi:MAG: MFS transporter [Sandaracinaceae bacterium]|nr:MFS transporter [Sandaracinaceae bacterium]
MVDALPPPDAHAPGARTSTRKLTAGLMLGVGVHAMEGFSIYTALPALTLELNARALYGAVITTYLLGSLVGLVWAGVHTDTRGPRGALRVGLGAIALGLLGATFAPDIYSLLVCRCLQGFGGGALTTVLYAAVHRAYPRAEQAQVLALLSLAWGGSAVAMPGLLGMIVDHLHWRYVFALGLPVAGLAAGLILPSLRGVEHQPRASLEAVTADAPARPRKRVLALAVTTLVAGATLGLHAPTFAGVPGWLLPALGGVAVVGWLVALWPAGVFQLRAVLPAAVGVKTLACALFFGAEAHLPLALTDIHQRGSTFTGLVLTAAAMAWSSAAFLQARLLPRLGASRIALMGVLGTALAVAGLLLLVDPSVTPYLALPIWALGAAGMGMVYNTTSDSALAATGEGDSGATGTALGISDSVGAALGTGVASGLLNAAPSLGVGLTWGWMALLVLAVPMAVGASRLGGRPPVGAPVS